MPSSTTRKAPQDRKPAAKRTTTRKTAEPQPSQGSPIPVAEDPTSKYAADAWLAGGVGGMEDLQVPSGQLCLVRRPGMEGLMKAGVLHNVDSLSQLVSEKHLKRVDGKDQLDTSSVMQDEKALDEIIDVVDKVVCHCVVKPEVYRTPNDVTLRKPGVVYADMIELTDKMFIFNFVVGGTRDLERFRGQLLESVGGVEAGEGVSHEGE